MQTEIRQEGVARQQTCDQQAQPGTTGLKPGTTGQDALPLHRKNRKTPPHLAHREEIRQKYRSGAVGAERFASNLCSTLPRIGRRVGEGPISFGARFDANDRTVPRLQAVDSISRE
jgi:hypothetical protein